MSTKPSTSAPIKVKADDPTAPATTEAPLTKTPGATKVKADDPTVQKVIADDPAPTS